MAHHVLHHLTQQLNQREAGGGDWVACAYTDHGHENTIRAWYKNGYAPADDTQAAVNGWYSLCAARGYQVMPGYQGVPHADATCTQWIVQYHVDMRGRRRTLVNA